MQRFRDLAENVFTAKMEETCYAGIRFRDFAEMFSRRKWKRHVMQGHEVPIWTKTFS